MLNLSFSYPRNAIILRYCISLLFFLALFSSVSAQKVNEKRLLKKAQTDLVNERYDQAREKYLKLDNNSQNKER